jgi:pseudouridine synthase
MRLNRYIAQATGISRRAADEAITAGRVRLEQKKAVLGQDISDRDKVYLDERLLATLSEFTYIIYYKPIGLVVSRRQQGNASTIYDRLPAEFENLRSVGRLDRESSGLLVLTDDGDYAHRQTHPSFEKTKRYEVRLNKPLEADDAKHLQQGVKLEDGMSKLGIESSEAMNVVVILKEGRNRQIRRSFAALDYRVVKLHRTDFGNLNLGGLKPGEWRKFTPNQGQTHA